MGLAHKEAPYQVCSTFTFYLCSMDGEVLVEGYDAFRAWFWNKTFWLPANRTWADLKRSDAPGAPFYPDLYDLYVVLPIAFALFLARLLWERYAPNSLLSLSARR